MFNSARNSERGSKVQALTVVVVVYLNGWAGLVEVGEGGRIEERLVWSWSEMAGNP